MRIPHALVLLALFAALHRPGWADGMPFDAGSATASVEAATPSAPGLATAASAGPAAASPTSAPAADDRPDALNLYVGQAHVLDEGEIRRLVIGNGKVIQATVLDDRQVLIIPEAPGQSTLHLWGRNGGQRSLVVNVIPADAARLLQEIRAMLGSATNVGARIVGDKVVVEGGNLSEEQAMRLGEISKRYPQIVNLVSRVGFERMIAMDVKMVEIRRDQLENLGVRWNGAMAGPSFQMGGDLHRSGALRPGGLAEGVAGLEVRPRLAPFVTSLGIVGSLTSMINLLVQKGDAVMLAEPSLSCRSGGSAKFVAGGELPIPFTTGLGNASVMFKEYGVKFDVSPVASETGVIAAKIATEISAVNFDVVVKDVPGLTKRRAETEVNLREHETLVIAGLLSEESSRSIDQLPALGELPVLGRLFRSRAFRDRQTELVVFITPRFADVERLPPSTASSTALSQDDRAPARIAPADRLRPAPFEEKLERARARVRIVE